MTIMTATWDQLDLHSSETLQGPATPLEGSQPATSDLTANRLYRSQPTRQALHESTLRLTIWQTLRNGSFHTWPYQKTATIFVTLSLPTEPPRHRFPQRVTTAQQQLLADHSDL